MRTQMRGLLILSIGILIGISLTLTDTVSAKRDPYPETLPLADIRNFTEVFARIKRDYVEETDDSELLEDAIQGMLSGLDPHSDYLNPKELQELTIDTSGEFGGLGIQVTMEDGFVKVIAPIDDTPAQNAGIKSGDLIIRLDDTSVKGMTLTDAVDVMRGKPGTDITLTVVREGLDKPLVVTITRAVIQVKSIKSRLLEPNYAYIRITQFQTKTTEHLHDAINTLKKENKDKLKGIVLDLRNNPGGVLNAAVSVSDTFLEKGLIVYTQGRDEDSKITYSARAGDAIDGVPLVVLINGGSASASEIVAGALQDHKRAIIIGSKSFGKGSVQTIQPLNQGGAIKLTTARYYTPNGRSIQAKGIIPDIVLDDRITLEVKEKEENVVNPLTEADLNGHLEGAEENKEQTEEKVKQESDYHIIEALNILKSLDILGKY